MIEIGEDLLPKGFEAYYTERGDSEPNYKNYYYVICKECLHQLCF